ncbi:hypothetical protein [Halomonas sp. B23F22_10]|uniref:hypothetical protein n=1 Tax=Halomonas sp. B23F22_10 TaxID=3459515 RepID=UPI00373DF409
MKWVKRNADSIQSGEWIISRARWGDGELFTLWRGTERIDSYGTAGAAKQAAERATKEKAA